MLNRHILHSSRSSSVHNEGGIALLSVVVVLSTLLIIGILFAFTVDLDLKASRYYRDAGQAEQIALEGLYRATAELQYDMWGVRIPGVQACRFVRDSGERGLLARRDRADPRAALQMAAVGRSRRRGPHHDRLPLDDGIR